MTYEEKKSDREKVVDPEKALDADWLDPIAERISAQRTSETRIDDNVDEVLSLLRNVMHRRGWTQAQVQSQLGWGRSYISQLFNRQKRLKMLDVLEILHVIGIEPGWFFSRIYHFPWSGSPTRSNPVSTSTSVRSITEDDDIPMSERRWSLEGHGPEDSKPVDLNGSPLARYLSSKPRF